MNSQGNSATEEGTVNSHSLTLDELAEQNTAFMMTGEELLRDEDVSSEESEDEVDVHVRLHNDVARTAREKNEAIVTILPSDSLRWIKRRRKINSKLKVAMSHYRERQLREIFSGLDIKTEGEIDLVDLKNAIAYVEESLKDKLGDQLTNLDAMFMAMDEDGNGKVDFQEFCAGMYGSTKSTLDKASEHAIEKLHWKFTEYARIYKRQKAIGR